MDSTDCGRDHFEAAKGTVPFSLTRKLGQSLKKTAWTFGKSALTRFGKFHILATSRMNPRGWVCIGWFRCEKTPADREAIVASMEAGGTLRIYERATGETAN
jgi:hypothetical protein